LAAFVSDEPTLTVFEAQTGRAVFKDSVQVAESSSQRTEQGPFSVDFSPDGSALVVGTTREVRAYDLTHVGEPGTDLADENALIARHELRSGATFARPVPGTSRAVITTLEGTVQVWDWSTDTVIWELSVDSRLGRATVSPDGTRFAIVVDDFIQEYYLDVDRLLAELGSEIRPLTEAECLTYLGAPDC